jgi:hypothetical protein
MMESYPLYENSRIVDPGPHCFGQLDPEQDSGGQQLLSKNIEK